MNGYTLIQAMGTRCPKCGSTPQLLAADIDVVQAAPLVVDIDLKPAFYVCYCGFVGQVGVAEVPGATLRIAEKSKLPEDFADRLLAGTNGGQ